MFSELFMGRGAKKFQLGHSCIADPGSIIQFGHIFTPPCDRDPQTSFGKPPLPPYDIL